MLATSARIAIRAALDATEAADNFMVLENGLALRSLLVTQDYLSRAFELVTEEVERLRKELEPVKTERNLEEQ